MSSKTIRVPVSNATPAVTAAILAAAKKGSFAWLTITKKGKEVRGVRYGDSRVRVCLVTGFLYGSLCERSLALLDDGVDFDWVKSEGAKRGYGLDDATIKKALEEIKESLKKSIARENSSTTDHVYETLMVDGQPVQGSRVYIGEPEFPEDPYSPVPTTIYLQGLKLSDQVLVEAPNGPIPKVNSRPKTVAKKIINSTLPKSRYRSYELSSRSDFELRIGGMPKVSGSDGVTTVEVNA